MALLVLLAEWARGRGVSVMALTVDHGLRSGSADEVAQVAKWCGEYGVSHHGLEWRGEKPVTGIQEAARETRYRLLTGWCRTHSCSDLFIAHNLDDQAETLLMRLARGSGVYGLAGMPLVSVVEGVRVVRPLLGVQRRQLEAFLRTRTLPWLDDPSNRDFRFTRVRMRRQVEELARAGLPRSSIARAVSTLGRMRARKDRDVAALAARAIALYPEGYAEIDREVFLGAEEDIAKALLSSLLSVIGGGFYPVRRERLDRLHRHLGSGAGARTLGHCLVERVRGRLRICREDSGFDDIRLPGHRICLRWDRRFEIELRGDRLGRTRSANLGALGQQGWASIAAELPGSALLPEPVRVSAPALRIDGKVAEVPHLDYRKSGGKGPVITLVRFRPPVPLCGAPFRLA